jgi:anti-sigma-K factor RskA
MAELPEWAREQAGEDELPALAAVHGALQRMAPPFEVPAGLAERVLPRPRPRRRLRLAWLAVPVAATAAAAVLALSLGPRAQRLESTVGEPVDVTATVRVTPVGREVELHIEQLRDPRPNGIYELWFVSAGDPDERVSAGTFHPDENGRGTVRLLAAAERDRYPRLSVTLEPADGDPRRQGPEVLR